MIITARIHLSFRNCTLSITVISLELHNIYLTICNVRDTRMQTLEKRTKNIYLKIVFSNQ